VVLFSLPLVVVSCKFTYWYFAEHGRPVLHEIVKKSPSRRRTLPADGHMELYNAMTNVGNGNYPDQCKRFLQIISISLKDNCLRAGSMA
jgi:hypothetical protein